MSPWIHSLSSKSVRVEHNGPFIIQQAALRRKLAQTEFEVVLVDVPEIQSLAFGVSAVTAAKSDRLLLGRRCI